MGLYFAEQGKEWRRSVQEWVGMAMNHEIYAKLV